MAYAKNFFRMMTRDCMKLMARMLAGPVALRALGAAERRQCNDLVSRGWVTISDSAYSLTKSGYTLVAALDSSDGGIRDSSGVVSEGGPDGGGEASSAQRC